MTDGFDINKMITSMNDHIPTSRRTLLDLLDSDGTSYKTRNGNICDIDRKEIEYLSSICTELEKMRLNLPIFVTTDTSGEGMAWKVDGVVESKVIAKILNKPQFREDSVRFYHPDYVKLLHTLPTSTVVLYLP